MKKAPIPKNEDERQEILDFYAVTDTEPEPEFDELTELASLLLDVPISLVSIVDGDRQWFKSKVGLDASETPRDVSFCGHAIMGDELFVIENALEDERFNDNPLVVNAPNVIFYAGAPLITPENQRLGTLCVIDHKPRKLDKKQRRILEIIRNQVVSQLILRKQNRSLAELIQDQM